MGTSQKRSAVSKSMKGFSMNGDSESMKQFNYLGQMRLENLDEHDVIGLEREIDFIIRHSQLGTSPHRVGTANGDYNIVDINGDRVDGQTHEIPVKKRNKTAGYVNPRHAKKKNLLAKKMRAAQQMAADINNQQEVH